MNGIIVSAPGKVIFHGEHAVVYGKMALASCLALRTYVRVQSQQHAGFVSVLIPDVGIEKEFMIDSLMRELSLTKCDPQEPTRLTDDLLSKLKTLAGPSKEQNSAESLALASFLYLYCFISLNNSLPPLRIEVRSNLPVGAGLGSSASFSTCLAAALLLNRNLIKAQEHGGGCATTSTKSWPDGDLELISKWAFQSEKIIHGNPSGIDNSVSTYGGALTFQKGIIKPLHSLPKFRVILFNTKQPRSTKELVSKVKTKYEKFPDVMEPIMCSIEGITQQCVTTCQSDLSTDKKFETFQELIEMNQALLDFIGVNHRSLKSICDIANKHGLSAKLTGAGGGGCAFALVSPGVKTDVVQTCIKDAQNEGFDAWETSIGGPGVLQHLTLDDPNYSIPFSNLNACEHKQVAS